MLTTGEEQYINNAMLGLHNFFASRNVFYALKEGQETVITQNSEHNFFYGDAPTNSQTVTTVETGQFTARSYYVRSNDNRTFDPLNPAGNSQNVNVNVEQGTVKVVTDASGKYFLEDADRVTWDDQVFKVKSTPNSHGLLARQFFTFYLEPVK